MHPDARQGLVNMNQPSCEIEILPPESQQLTPPQPCAKPQEDSREQPMLGDR
jgi:hypothetical protein